jgi:large subunit ribosomal protein L29
MKAKELRQKNNEALQAELKELARARYSARIQLATQQSNKTHLIRQYRRDIARILTVLRQRQG